MIDFWATWCGGCVAAFPEVAKLQNHFKDEPVEIIGLTSLQGSFYEDGKEVDSSKEPEREYEFTDKFCKKRDVSWPIAFSRQDVINPEFGIGAIPHVAVIDAQGRLRYSGGFSLEQEIELVESLLEELQQE